MERQIMISNERSQCGHVRLSDRGKTIRLMGWVDSLRDHGDVLFIHLRDRSGIVQVVFNPEELHSEVYQRAVSLRNEYCVAVDGHVVRRADTTENSNIKTGKIEVIASDLTIFSRCAPLPFPISEKAMVAGGPTAIGGSVNEEIRLKYRYLDLRRPTMQEHLMKRDAIMQCVRGYLHQRSFIEVETPILTKSTPEGARDYLVPSRGHHQQFYALPQSPQLFKQLLMIGGLEKYFQIARCFRDEDLRPNRQPEFTQLDIEASFIDEEFIYELMEELVIEIFAIGDIHCKKPFPRMTWQEAMDTMGTDRPDIRFGLRFVEATDIFENTSYGIFRNIVANGGCIRGLNIKGQSDKLSKKVLQNEYAHEIVPSFGARGMTWMRVIDGKLESNIVRFFGDDEQVGIRERFQAEDGDVIIMIADQSPRMVNEVLGLLRLHLATRLDLIPHNEFAPVWVTDFPLFEQTRSGLTSTHHPFTAPHRTDFDPGNQEELLTLRSRAYDLVINGEEVGGGSIRINDRDLQTKIFQALGLSDGDVNEKFGFFLHALEYAAPPHGGIALGMDRIISMVLGTSSIREVIPFPKNRNAYCPLTDAPSHVSYGQLSELGLLDPKGGKWIQGRKVL